MIFRIDREYILSGTCLPDKRIVKHQVVNLCSHILDQYILTTTIFTRATLNMNQLMFGLSNPSASPDHAYYGVTDIGIDKSIKTEKFEKHS